METAYREEKFQVAWDNTSLELLRACPRKYYLHNIMGLRPSGESVHLTFGILYHGALEQYDHAIAQGQARREATITAVRWALRESWGWVSDHKVKDRQSLVRAVVSYIEEYKADTAKTVVLANGRAAVELSCRVEIPLDNPWGEPYLLCGHLDKLAEFADATWIFDKKTTTRTLGADYMSQFKPSGQMMQYTFMGKVVWNEPIVGVMIEAVQLQAHGDTFLRFPVKYTEGQLNEWLDNTKFLIKMAEQYARAGFWPMHTAACHHYGGCPFRELCGRDPSVRDAFMRNYKIDRWDPIKVRGVSE